jgi:hypothetical protein
MIQKNKHLKEYWYVNHRNDDLKHTGFDYENNLFRKLFSGLMFDNPKLNEFLTKLQEMVVLMLESTLVVRNFWNYTVDKYYNKHNN